MAETPEEAIVEPGTKTKITETAINEPTDATELVAAIQAAATEAGDPDPKHKDWGSRIEGAQEAAIRASNANRPNPVVPQNLSDDDWATVGKHE